MSLGSENGARSWGGDVGGFEWKVLSCGEEETPETQGEWGGDQSGEKQQEGSLAILSSREVQRWRDP